MRFLTSHSRRKDQARQVMSRLSALETYNGVSQADPIETAKRLERLRYGTVGNRAAS